MPYLFIDVYSSLVVESENSASWKLTEFFSHLNKYVERILKLLHFIRLEPTIKLIEELRAG
jgi:hypothetical protein